MQRRLHAGFATAWATVFCAPFSAHAATRPSLRATYNLEIAFEHAGRVLPKKIWAHNASFAFDAIVPVQREFSEVTLELPSISPDEARRIFYLDEPSLFAVAQQVLRHPHSLDHDPDPRVAVVEESLNALQRELHGFSLNLTHEKIWDRFQRIYEVQATTVESLGRAARFELARKVSSGLSPKDAAAWWQGIGHYIRWLPHPEEIRLWNIKKHIALWDRRFWGIAQVVQSENGSFYLRSPADHVMVIRPPPNGELFAAKGRWELFQSSVPWPPQNRVVQIKKIEPAAPISERIHQIERDNGKNK